MEQVIFGYAEKKVNIIGVSHIENGHLTFEIEGADVPQCEEVIGIFNAYQNFRGDRLVKMVFEPVATIH